MNKHLRSIGLLAATTALLAACGGGGGEDDDDNGNNQTYSIVGSITGLTTSGLVLQNNGAAVTVASGATQTTLASNVSSGATYSVTVQTQPAGQNCTVANGSGTVSGNVSNIAITCTAVSTATYNVGGTITGYTGSGLGLRLNGQTGATFNTTPTSGAASFGFAAELATGAAYTVNVAAQPTNPVQRCTVNSGGAGTIGAADVSNVNVVCTDSVPYTVSGTVAGLTGIGLSLGMGYTGAAAPEVLDVVAGATSFEFAAELPANGAFTVGIRTQPAGQACVIARSRGSSSVAVTDVAVVCADHVANPLRGTYSLLTDEGRQYLNFNADGTFTTALIHNDTGCNATGDTRNGNGVEHGVFEWNQATGAFSLPIAPVIDNNGECGFANAESFADSFDGSLQRAGNTLVVQSDGEDDLDFTAEVSPDPATSLTGAYVGEGNNGVVLVLHADNTYMVAETQGRGATLIGQERGCYLATATDITFSVGGDCRPDGLDSYDLNGAFGAGPFSGTVTSIGPVPYVIENATTVVIGPFRYRRTAPN